jgi:hypothetical protein
MKLLRPILNRIRQRAGQPNDFWSQADGVWDIAPAETRHFPPAIFLPDQLERITETVFANRVETIEAVTSDRAKEVRPTRAARFRDVNLVDGVLYKSWHEYHLRPRKSRLPLLTSPDRTMSGALYDSWTGLRYFGSWLMDDTETYRLAERIGGPTTLRANSTGHFAEYERRLAMNPERITGDVHFDELILFQDMGNNSDKIARAADRRTRLLAGRTVVTHPGIFLLRGHTGDLRMLENEMALAEELELRHGIRIMQPLDHSVEELLQACAGSRLIIGVEGSQLTHALTVMPPGGSILALCPPDRMTAALKLMTDRLGLHFAFVIGTGTVNGFTIAADEVEATLQLLP